MRGKPYAANGGVKLVLAKGVSKLQHIELHLVRLSHHLLGSEKQSNAADVGE